MKYALINYKKANLDSTIKGLFHLSINDLENYLSFIQCPHVFMSTRLHVYTYTSVLIEGVSKAQKRPQYKSKLATLVKYT